MKKVERDLFPLYAALQDDTFRRDYTRIIEVNHGFRYNLDFDVFYKRCTEPTKFVTSTETPNVDFLYKKQKLEEPFESEEKLKILGDCTSPAETSVRKPANRRSKKTRYNHPLSLFRCYP